MLAKVTSCAVIGLDGQLVDVEVDIGSGQVMFTVVGLPDTAVQESRERVRSAIKNSGLNFPLKRVTVNLAPADLRKEGPAYDLPIAVGLLVVVIGASMGMNAGYAINPARDLGPRLFTFVAGWGAEVFRAGNYSFWVPIVGPICGGIAGTWIYDLFIGKRFPREQ